MDLGINIVAKCTMSSDICITMMLYSLLYTLSMDVKTAHFSDEQTVNNIKRGKRVKVLFARLDTESISTSNF